MECSVFFPFLSTKLWGVIGVLWDEHAQLINLAEDEFICKVAKTVEEATKLVESGFDYVTDIDGCKLFKKRKWKGG